MGRLERMGATWPGRQPSVARSCGCNGCCCARGFVAVAPRARRSQGGLLRKGCRLKAWQPQGTRLTAARTARVERHGWWDRQGHGRAAPVWLLCIPRCVVLHRWVVCACVGAWDAVMCCAERGGCLPQDPPSCGGRAGQELPDQLLGEHRRQWAAVGAVRQQQQRQQQLRWRRH